MGNLPIRLRAIIIGRQQRRVRSRATSREETKGGDRMSNHGFPRLVTTHTQLIVDILHLLLFVPDPSDPQVATPVGRRGLN